MKMKNNFLRIALLAAFVSFSGCETLDLEQTESPSQVQPNLLDPVFVFNYVQLQLPDFVNSANGFTQEVTRQMAMTGGNTYDNAFAPVNFNNNWNIGYNMLNAIKLMEPKAIEKQEYYALGASKVIRVYVLMALVDMYGNIPYSEALLGSENLNPNFDNSASVYAGLLSELDDAIVTLQLANASGSAVQDLYYGSQANWITLANTIKLKMLNNARLAGGDIGVSDVGAAITAIFNAGDYIDTPEEDFAFQYGNSRFNPNTRHPLYNDQYELGGGAYIGNYIMWAMTTEKGFSTAISTDASATTDPRVPFYFYKQDANPNGEDEFTLPGRARPEHYNNDEYDSFYNPSVRTPFTVSNWVSGSIPNDGFWGRDHGNNAGIPPDANKRTVGGIYPIGGTYGAPGSVQTGGDKGAQGAGIMPIIMSSFVHFIKAEAILTLGVSGNARQELQLGIEQSIDKTVNLVPDFPYLAGSAPNFATISSQKSNYVNFTLTKYDNASTNKLELIIKEYYIASWGNGLEAYNNYRRTGYPSNFQPTLEEASGDFYYTAYYPGNAENNNPNTPANVRTRKVFWDKANLNLH
jgi:hypothetical protein